MKTNRAALPLLLAALGVTLLFTTSAHAQMGGMGTRGPAAGPTQSGPTQNKQVGPRAYGDEDEDQRVQVTQRAEPSVGPPADPLAVSPELRARMGTDYDSGPPPPFGQMHRSFFPYYEESRGDYRFRLLPPLWLEHTRGLPNREDRESLFALLYYQRRSRNLDADVLFPLAWSVREKQNHVWVLGPIAHREAPFEHDNWLAPLVFEGERKDGGYFHSLPLLTTSHWGEKGAFTMSALYFRDRTGTDVDWGVVPFFFHGDNGNTDGARKTYSLVPPLLYYHTEQELEESQLTVIGPVVSKSNPKRSIFDVAPLFFHIDGRPETGGVRESHTTLFPLFHYGTSDKQTLFVLPGYLRRVTDSVDTMLTPIYSHSTTRKGATSLSLLGPVLPLYYHYRDSDIGLTAWYVAPLYFQSDSPAGHSFLTPLIGHFESYGLSRTWWFFPSIVTTSDLHGFEHDIYPLLFVGRSDESAHTVAAPVFWDFANPRGRTTVAFPLYWRFADTTDGSLTQIAANTLYREKRAVGGKEWQFHLLPVFSYGESPRGSWWNVLFGLAGYDHDGGTTRIKAFWIPITVSSGPDPRQTAAAH
jgi:hypothetical protein